MELKKNCNNCLNEGHSESQCLHPTWCVECKDRGHNVAKCPQAKCFNCQQLGHMYLQCQNPPWCPKCKKVGHTLKNCPKGLFCTKCGREGHGKSRCSNPVKCHEMLQRKELDLDEENNEVSEVTDVVPMPASGDVVPATVPAPRLRVQHQRARTVIQRWEGRKVSHLRPRRPH